MEPKTITRPSPLEYANMDLLNFWWNQCGYKTTKYNEPIHKALTQPQYDEFGNPVPTLVVLAGGEQSGKSWLGGHHLFGMFWHGKIFWIVGDRYEDTRKECEYLIEAGQKAGVIDRVSAPLNSSWEITFKNGAVIKTKSSQDATTLAGESPDGILMVEAGRQSYQAFRILWGRAMHNTAWFLVSGTFEATKGRWYPDLWKQLQTTNEYNGVSMSLPSYANPDKYPDGEFDPKIVAARRTLTEDEFAERFLGVPRPTIGIVFPEFRRTVHVNDNAEYMEGFPTRLFVDPGYNPSAYAVLFTQNINGQVRIYDELYEHELVNQQILDIVLNHPRFRSIERVVIDVASKAHAGAQDPSFLTWQRQVTPHNIPVVAKYVKIEDGLKRTHDKLRINPLTNEPFLLLHPRCKNTIFEFEEGYKYPTRRTGDVGSSTLPIDKDNHAMKALAYGLVDTYGFADSGQVKVLKPVKHRMAYDRR